MSSPWGPRPAGVEPQASPPQSSGCLQGLAVAFAIGLVLVGLLAAGGLAGVGGSSAAGPAVAIALGACVIAASIVALVIVGPMLGRRRAQKGGTKARAAYETAWQTWILNTPQYAIANSSAPLTALLALDSGTQTHQHARPDTGFAGITPQEHSWVRLKSEDAVLVLGPPRSGKTQGVIMPSIVATNGPVVTTSTKNDVLLETSLVRRRLGTVWLFDPSAESETYDGVKQLRWSPVSATRTWDKAREMADAMVGASSAGQGVTDSTHWIESAKRHLGPLLYAAASGGYDMSEVRRWSLRGDFDNPLAILESLDAAGHGRGPELAVDSLKSIARMSDRERAAVLSTTATVLAAYESAAVLDACADPNFDPDEFVSTRDTVYIVSSSQQQRLLAPIIAGLLEAIRDAVYVRARRGPRPYVLFALDEVANIAPLASLPGMVSEAGGQGLHLMACLQDLSQARMRWGAAADGFLSLFGTKIVFPGIGDPQTLQALSVMAGDWDRPYVGLNWGTTTSGNAFNPSGSTTEGSALSYQREALLSPSEISNIPADHALMMCRRSGGPSLATFSLVKILPYYKDEPWRSIVKEAQALAARS
jgi:type IV secretion system protein VirD4